jgi:hypothetical protein
MADPDEKDEIDEIESPRDGMAHSRLPQAPNILPAESEDGPEDNRRKETGGYEKGPSHLLHRSKDAMIFLGNGFAILHPIPLLLDR